VVLIIARAPFNPGLIIRRYSGALLNLIPSGCCCPPLIIHLLAEPGNPHHKRIYIHTYTRWCIYLQFRKADPANKFLGDTRHAFRSMVEAPPERIRCRFNYFVSIRRKFNLPPIDVCLLNLCCALLFSQRALSALPFLSQNFLNNGLPSREVFN